MEEVKAAAGMDIGGTLIGMHLRRVAVPVRLSMDHIGEAILLCARHPPAVYWRQPRGVQRHGGALMDEAQKQAMAEAVARIRENMTTAAKAAGRDPGEVLLCAACKTRTVEEVRYSADLPIDLFGENHVQELVEKTDAGAYNGKPGHFIRATCRPQGQEGGWAAAALSQSVTARGFWIRSRPPPSGWASPRRS